MPEEDQNLEDNEPVSELDETGQYEAENEPGFGDDANEPGTDKDYGLVSHQLNKGYRQQALKNKASEQWNEAKDQAKQFIKDKVKQAALQAIKAAASAAWSWLVATVGPYAAVIIVVILLILLVAVPAFGLWSKARKGAFGNSVGSLLSASASSSSADSKIAMSELRELMGQKLVISDNPSSFYFCQADPQFNQEPLNGKWPSGRNRLKQAGCAITSLTMIMRYYGITDITPVDVGNKIAEKNGGSLNLDVSVFNDYLRTKNLPVKNATRVGSGYFTLDNVKKSIMQGKPILAGGNKVCGSGGEHWVVIIGVSKDGKSIIISDPAGGWRSSPARYCNSNQLGSNITKGVIFE